MRDIAWYPEDRKPTDPEVFHELYRLAFVIPGPQRESNLVNPNPRAQEDRHRLGLGVLMPALYRRSQDPAVDRTTSWI